MFSDPCRALPLCGWGITVPWWLHIVEPTRSLWTYNKLVMRYVVGLLLHNKFPQISGKLTGNNTNSIFDRYLLLIVCN